MYVISFSAIPPLAFVDGHSHNQSSTPAKGVPKQLDENELAFILGVAELQPKKY
jgi:hypothetical protein